MKTLTLFTLTLFVSLSTMAYEGDGFDPEILSCRSANVFDAGYAVTVDKGLDGQYQATLSAITYFGAQDRQYGPALVEKTKEGDADILVIKFDLRQRHQIQCLGCYGRIVEDLVLKVNTKTKQGDLYFSFDGKPIIDLYRKQAC